VAERKYLRRQICRSKRRRSRRERRTLNHAHGSARCDSAEQLGQRQRAGLPLIEPLVDNLKYFRPDDLPPPAGEELRSLCRPKVDKLPTGPEVRTCAPSLRGRGRMSHDDRRFIEAAGLAIRAGAIRIPAGTRQAHRRRVIRLGLAGTR
jgi:hypothetical protein